MLQFDVKQADILKISSFLARYNINAEITNQTVTVDGDISDELLNNLQNYITFGSVRNFENSLVNNFENYLKPEEVQCENASKEPDNISPEYAKKSFDTEKKVYYGGIYMCDFGTPFGSEQGYIRPAIVVQNKVGNEYSSSTIVVPCTSGSKPEMPTHLKVTLSSYTTLDCKPEYDLNENTILGEQIRVVDKARLKHYIGILKPEIMKKIQDMLRISLNIKNQEHDTKKIEKNDGAEKVVIKTADVPTTKIIRKDVDIEHLKILQLVNIKDLFEISSKYISDEEKAKQILELFGFNLEQNGVQYLLKAIIKSPKDEYFNLETLIKEVSKDETLLPEKIKSLIIARIKETLGFKKSPTIEFIRLINIFLNKQEETSYEKNDI
ncbi:MAG: type II toxin-antitoxin system PemK/MazF family toxin [Clostridia bacterium]|nr:type II toxin-antitoxin system PemK/MazF family toxin [Clostridia bacterium]